MWNIYFTTNPNKFINQVLINSVCHFFFFLKLPEMNSAAKDEDRKSSKLCNWRVFFLQNSGILIGYGLLLLMAVYGEQINFE